MASTRKIILMGQLVDLNSYIQAERSSRSWAAKIKKEETEKVASQLYKEAKINRPVSLGFHWFISTKHDYDNICFARKFILDGMVLSQVLPNDNPSWVLGFDGDEFYHVPKGEEKIIIELKERNLTS